jgi:DNA ligase-1
VREFTDLLEELDRTTSVNARIDALARHFAKVPPEDAAFAVWFLAGGRPKRPVSSTRLRAWVGELTGLPDWLVAECRAQVGDSAETVALLLDALPPAGDPERRGLAAFVEEEILPLASLPADQRRARVLAALRRLPPAGRFVYVKLLTGAFRSGVAKTLVVKALARLAGLDPATVAHRLAGEFRPSAAAFRALLAADGGASDPSRPYPFHLASPLDVDPATLGPAEDWVCEWKWDGIRAQLLRRAGGVFLWSRGEEAIGGSFPELVEAATRLPPGTVLDGEILAWGEAGVRPFADLQRRLGRRQPPAKLLREVPVAFLAYDLLEESGADIRSLPFVDRRARLERLAAGFAPPLRLSPLLAAATWPQRAALRERAREIGVEGLMLKRLGGTYGVGRVRGDVFKWKVDPFTVDAVLVYARPGSGRRASLHTDLGFAVWRDGVLVPVANAYSGLTDREFGELDRWIRRHTVERFGPVRRVEPVLVFELAFEGIARSKRHRAGLALRFPRILRWRREKKPDEADRIDTLLALLTGPADTSGTTA